MIGSGEGEGVGREGYCVTHVVHHVLDAHVQPVQRCRELVHIVRCQRRRVCRADLNAGIGQQGHAEALPQHVHVVEVRQRLVDLAHHVLQLRLTAGGPNDTSRVVSK